MPLCEVLPSQEVNRYHLVFDDEADGLMRSVWLEKLIDANRRPEEVHLSPFDGVVVMRPEDENLVATCDYPDYIVGELEAFCGNTEQAVNELISQTLSGDTNSALIARIELGKNALVLAQQIKTDFTVLEIANLEHIYGLEFTTDCFRAGLHLGITPN